MYLHLLLAATGVTDPLDADNYFANETVDRVHQVTLAGPNASVITAKVVVEVTNFKKGGWIVEAVEKTIIKPAGKDFITDFWTPVSGPYAFIRARTTAIDNPDGRVTVTMGGV